MKECRLWQQLPKDKYEIRYSKPRESKITRRNLALASIYTLNAYYMKYSKNIVTTEEELDMEVMHFKFLSKYNLL